MTAIVEHRGLNSGRGPSPAIWADFDKADLLRPGLSNHVFDDFTNVVSDVSLYYHSNGNTWKTIEDSGSVVAQSATAGRIGALTLTMDNTDNDEIYMQFGSATGNLFKLDASSGTKFWYECRFKVSVVTDSTYDLIVGLAEEGAAAADAITDADAYVDKDFIGFRVPAADGNGLDFFWKKSGQTEVELIADAATLVADTYVKVGFVFDPDAPTTKRIKVYVDGVESNTYGTYTQMAAATFPSGEELTPFFAIKAASGAIRVLTLDWVRAAQIIE